MMKFFGFFSGALQNGQQFSSSQPSYKYIYICIILFSVQFNADYIMQQKKRKPLLSEFFSAKRFVVTQKHFPPGQFG